MYTWEECAGNQSNFNKLWVGSPETIREAPYIKCKGENIVRPGRKLLIL
jgi:hypothetical protein